MSDAPILRVTHTPNYNLNLPDVGGDWDLWGDQTNANWTFIDGALLPIWGGNMTGLLGLSGDPTTALGAATKQYVDAVAAQLPGYLARSGGQMTGPLITLAGTGGSSLGIGIGNNTTGFWSTGNALVVQTGGGTNLILGGPTGNTIGVATTMAAGATFTLAGAPVGNLEAATKIYVDQRTPITIDALANNQAYGRYNNAWVQTVIRGGDTMTGLLILSADPVAALGAVTKQYVDARAGVPDAPSDGQTYGRAGGAWTPALPLAGGTLGGGLHFGGVAASSSVDLSRHIDLYSGTFGFCITSARMNIVVPVGASAIFVAGDGTDILQVTEGAITAHTTLSFASTLASGPTDLSHHINLFGLNGYGINVTSGRQNIVAGGVAALQVGSANILATVPVALPADPVTALQAATKQYVDAGDAKNAGRNLAHNGNFRVNQRGYATGAALAAGIYGFDRWKAGAGGGTATFAAAVPNTTITITAGTFAQIIEGGDIAGGAYTLSWSGTAGGRFGASGAFAGSPVTVTGIVAGTNTQIEFSTGTLGTVQLEAGSVASSFEQPRIGAQTLNCQRYFQPVAMYLGLFHTGAGQAAGTSSAFLTPMRGTPTLTIAFNGSSNFNAGAPGLIGVSGVYMAGSSAASGNTSINIVINCDAEL